ncbi:HD-GYP domain-containing protein [Gorillibacterium timonense]|uniref:HD-GYP domain-containing protein n=1 Tax=Gorillibacterium timonense TaxID=1689269 RepID=UPI001F3CCB4D|nr:HD domain-containing phosphohydrolase [Gorillibacterium timonense]
MDELHHYNDLYRQAPKQNAMEWMEFLSRKYPATYRHCVRVAILAEKLADGMAIGEEEKKKLVIGCFLHDVGKGLLPTELWNQQASLSPEQWDTLKLHPNAGADLIRTSSELNPDILGIIRHHHEHWDGTGYPSGLKGEEIPYLARICAVLDAFDSMVSEHPYAEMKSLDEAKEELVRCSSTQFDETIVQAFLQLPNSMLGIYMDTSH